MSGGNQQNDMSLSAVVFIMVETIWFIPLEEKALLEKYPAEYSDYQKKVRMWI